LHAEIDAGPTLFVKKFTYTDPSVNIDHVFDPLVRAATLTAFLDASDPGKPLSPVFSNEKGDTYYIIHPVLKHAAILKAKRERVDGYATVLERNDVSGA
jgi:methionyl-tRNA formyltransferase